MELGDTPWVDRAWRKLVDRVQVRDDIEEKWVPRVSNERPLRFQEYGCGAYGCVSPTEQPGVVVKLTSDASEALFVAWALTVPKPAAGLIRFHKVMAVPDATYRGRPLYVLWRDEAVDVGALDVSRQRGVGHAVHAHQLEVTYLNQLMENARQVGQALKRWRARMSDEGFVSTLQLLWDAYQAPGTLEVPKHVTVVLVAVQKAEHYMQELSRSRFKGIATALLHYLKRGVLLADVRGANVARRIQTYGSPGDWVIIDPGMSIVLNPAVEIPAIETL